MFTSLDPQHDLSSHFGLGRFLKFPQQVGFLFRGVYICCSFESRRVHFRSRIICYALFFPRQCGCKPARFPTGTRFSVSANAVEATRGGTVYFSVTSVKFSVNLCARGTRSQRLTISCLFRPYFASCGNFSALHTQLSL